MALFSLRSTCFAVLRDFALQTRYLTNKKKTCDPFAAKQNTNIKHSYGQKSAFGWVLTRQKWRSLGILIHFRHVVTEIKSKNGEGA